MTNEQAVKYPKLGLFTGRNGTFKSAGVVIRETAGAVQVQPITSRGKLGTCLIELPSDRTVFSQLADVFRQLAEAEPLVAK
ncbi:hypothetical protein BSFA1_82770 (plasmid) [Burkholderia sp. SFA1]|uniref:hypothetical protein n=1 Tax=Caballeronia TaxID=1827195 RepID=UPI0002387DD4|nr:MULTISPECIES: hypothetical protein [Caballeronia]AET95455.1 hypothetical protein BYI23_E002940 [Burkholderia sp. YI23]MCB4349916.1 hypothetical protein [Burkholderia vietnamiensis]MDR5799297.1 hypothetical protein [Caballeronia sp. LZ001]BBQ03149.1 hypothetical protein BSFA1_82770 [Burkholderia sp. SFA1]